jgi:hypothetical protein
MSLAYGWASRPGRPQIKKLVLLSIFPTPNDYRVNNPVRKVALLATDKRRCAMKYMCLRYYEPAKHVSVTEDEKHAMFANALSATTTCANGHFADGEALQPAETG